MYWGYNFADERLWSYADATCFCVSDWGDCTYAGYDILEVSEGGEHGESFYDLGGTSEAGDVIHAGLGCQRLVSKYL